MVEAVRVAVSGVGGGVGQSIMKALEGTHYEVVALDSEVLGVGLYAAKTSYVIPYASAPEYVDRLLDICQAEKCELFFPGLDAELPVLAKAIDRFEAIGTRVIVSSDDVIELSDNKMQTVTRLAEQDISVPRTIDMSAFTTQSPPMEYPFILKVKIGGARSQGLHLIKGPEEWEALMLSGLDLQNFVAQQYIEGDEYTCGSINLNEECKGVIVMRRILRDGDTYKCFSEKNEVIEKEVRKVMAAIKPFGACNVQLRMQHGKPYVFEINARCSGTTAARALCGFNEPKMIADYLTAGIEPEYEVKELSILRYWKEMVVANESIEAMSEQRSVQGQHKKLL